MIYEHRFRVHASQQVVTEFHHNPASMAAITPPPVITQVHSAPQTVVDGAEMKFTLWLGPLPVFWQAQFEQVSATGFHDRQVKGPFTSWVHKHDFLAIDSQTTEVYDRVEAQYHLNPFWRLVGMAMWLNLPILFAFRGWRTRRLLER